MDKKLNTGLATRLGHVLGVQTSTYKMERMDKFIIERLTEMEGVTYTIDTSDNIYAMKGDADVYPCVVSHKDTVHDIHDEFYVTFVNGYYAAFNEDVKQVGIGGDDKVGIFITLEMLRTFDNIKVAFFSDEEIGCVGSSQSDTRFFSDVGYIFQCDRNSGRPNDINRDFVCSIGGSKIMSKKFGKKIKKTINKYGYGFTTGGLTDVDQLGDNGIEVSMANMSCGYFYPHTDDEVVSYSETINTMNMVEELIRELGENKYKFNKPVGTTYGNYYGGKRGYSNYTPAPVSRRSYIGYIACPECHTDDSLWKDDDYEYCLTCGYEKQNGEECDTIILHDTNKTETAVDGCTCNNCGDWITYEGTHLYCSRCDKQYELKKEDVKDEQTNLIGFNKKRWLF